MPLFLRFVAMSIGLGVVSTLGQAWRLSVGGQWDDLLRMGSYGMATAMFYLLMLTFGPFAAVQLWRLRDSGRRAAAFMSLFASAYYVIQFNTSANSLIWFYILLTLLFVQMLLSPPAKRACQTRLSEVEILTGSSPARRL